MSNASDFVIENGVLIKYTGPGGDVVIPEGVTEIGREAFMNCKKICAVYFPDSVEMIGARAFANCENLSGEINIPNPECAFGGCVFQNCNITSVRIPIKNRASYYEYGGMFKGCNSLRTVHYTTPLVVKVYMSGQRRRADILHDKDAFSETGLEVIYAPFCKISDLEYHKEQAVVGFAKMMLAKEVVVDPDIVTENKKYITSQRKRLYQVAMKSHVLLRYMIENKIIPSEDIDLCLQLAVGQENYEAMAILVDYQNNSSNGKKQTKELELTEISQKEKIIRNAPTVSELKALWDFKKNLDGSLTLLKYKGNDEHVIVPDKIGRTPVSELRSTFFENKVIRSVIIPEGVRTISGKTFCGCESLENITFPASLANIWNFGIDICMTPFDNTPWQKKQGDFVIASNLLVSYRGKEKDVNIPDGVVKVCNTAFMERNGIERIIMPDSVLSVEEMACGCIESLYEVILSNELRRIGEYAFGSCEQLQCIRIPSVVDEIASDAFGYRPTLTIVSGAGSYAEQYAKEHNIPFVAE